MLLGLALSPCVTRPTGTAIVTPDDIFGSSLQGWLLENYTAASGVWVDETGTANTSQGTSSKRPGASTINSHVCADFDGVDDALNWGGDRDLFTTELTVWAVVQTSTIGAGGHVVVGKIYGNTAWGLGKAFGGTANKLSGWAESWASFAESDSVLNDGAVHTLVLVAGSGVTTLYVDGVAQATTGTFTAIADSADFLSVGSAMFTGEGTTDYYWNGKIANVGLVNVAASAGQLDQLHTYLLDWAGL